MDLGPCRERVSAHWHRFALANLSVARTCYGYLGQPLTYAHSLTFLGRKDFGISLKPILGDLNFLLCLLLDDFDHHRALGAGELKASV